MTEEPRSARDLVRKRARSYKQDETGRHHHIGAAPERQPLLTDDGGATLIGTSAVQLASRTVPQLREQRARTAREMALAAEELRFEDAARLRDDLAAVDRELERRT